MFYPLIFICLLMLWWLKKNQGLSKRYKRTLKLPFIDHDYNILSSIQMHKAVRNISMESLQNGGSFVRYLGPIKILGLTDPDDCLTVMNTCLKRHYVYGFSKEFLGDNGLITADVPLWKKTRKLLNPAFNQQVLDGYVNVFNSQAQRLVEMFASTVEKPFDQEHLLRINNLETICFTSFGIDTSEYRDLLEEYMPQLSKLMRYCSRRMQKFWFHSDFIYNWSTEKKEFVLESQRFKKLTKQIIEKKKLKRKSETNVKKTDDVVTFLDYLLDLADETGSLTDDYIRSETDTNVASGHDTSSTTLAFVLTLLGSHKDVQEKAFEEVQRVFVNSKTSIDKDDLSRLIYIEAIIKETMRLYPLLPILGRHVDRDVKLKNFTIKANTDCYVLVYGLHRHSIWGPDAEQFRPERWLKKETLPDPKYFGGFGLGRRACIGKAYAMMSMKISLAYVVRNFLIFSDVSKMVLKLHGLARPVTGHFITLSLRNTKQT